MKFNKQIAVILVLSSLLISAIGAALYLFYEGENIKKANAQQLTIYVAKRDIPKNSLVKEADITKTVIAKRYLLTKPLLKKEIINKFARESIFKNEMFRKEKLTKEIDKVDLKPLPFKFNSYNASYKLFHNPNFSLIKGDIINIVSVYPKSKSRDNLNYNVRYVAKQVQIVGFLEKGKIVEKGFRKVKKLVKSKKKKMKEAKKATYQMVKVYADELILDISDKVILAMTDDYNKGKQLWMVKTNQVKAEPIKKVADKIVIMNKKASKKVVKRAKRVYRYKRYMPKNTSYTKTAIIEYADAKIENQTQKTVITNDLIKQCMNERKVLVGVSRKVHLRTIPSNRGKIKRIVYRNYIIPYTSKINSNWYQVCDGRYVHINEAKEISYEKSLELLLNKKPTIKKVTAKKVTAKKTAVKKTAVKEVTIAKEVIKAKDDGKETVKK